MDNLLDDLGGDVIISGGAITRESKKKSLSTKNLSLNTTTTAAAPAADQETADKVDEASDEQPGEPINGHFSRKSNPDIPETIPE